MWNGKKVLIFGRRGEKYEIAYVDDGYKVFVKTVSPSRVKVTGDAKGVFIKFDKYIATLDPIYKLVRKYKPIYWTIQYCCDMGLILVLDNYDEKIVKEFVGAIERIGFGDKRIKVYKCSGFTYGSKGFECLRRR